MLGVVPGPILVDLLLGDDARRSEGRVTLIGDLGEFELCLGLTYLGTSLARSRAEDVGAGVVAATPADAVSMVDVVLTSLTGADALRATFGGPTGALAAARRRIFVEMSTAGPDVLEELAPLVTKTGSTFVDAPVVGAPPNVLKGAALLIAGGERADVERVQPVLERLGELRHAGPFGSGIRLKLVANSMLGALVLVSEDGNGTVWRIEFDLS